ncbi:MAG: hypothetical protein LAP13_17395 [Acidobacteriia bacterium]|nr:hypothetical protein [Terriglobia bacterium]
MGATGQQEIRKDDLAEDERWQLVERIAASPAFHKSARVRDLLLYLTERTLHGYWNQLSEQKIGHAVFGKPVNYSPLEDSSVRVHVRQLRLRLHEYFDSVGRSEPIIVEIPKGSYVPVFRSVQVEGAPGQGLRDRGPSKRWALAVLIPWLLCAILAAACLVLVFRLHAARNAAASPAAAASPPWPLSQIFDAQHRTCIVVADVNYGMLRIISHRPGSLEDYLKPDFPQGFVPSRIGRESAPIMNYISDSVLTSFADVAVLTSLLNNAEGYRDRVFVRSARDLRLRDLDEGNFVFLGSPGSNPWVQLFEGRLNFQETEGAVGESPKAFLNKDPRPGEKKAYEGLRFTGTTGEDYADIALLPSNERDGSILILQGLQQEGTEAAGRFLASPDHRRALREALGLAADPKGKIWFEALIRTKAVDGAPNSEKIIAARVVH